MRRPLRALAYLVFIAATAVDLAATTARRLSNEEMTDTADVIVIGRVTDVRSVWETPRVLVTVVTVAVSERLKGEVGESISVAVPGGSDANRKFPIAMTYAGAPRMGEGEDVFLFLSRDPDMTSSLTVMGFSQGKFSIVDDGKGGKAVARDLTQVTLVGGTGAVRGAVTLVGLSEFKQEILEYLR
jgi:hypothetical protein